MLIVTRDGIKTELELTTEALYGAPLKRCPHCHAPYVGYSKLDNITLQCHKCSETFTQEPCGTTS